MLSVILNTSEGKEIKIESLLSLTLSCDEDTPCDSLNMVFEGLLSDEFSEVVLLNEGVVVFEGIVDEQISLISHREKTQIVARSNAARLVDNEAYPETYNFPDTELIFSRYLKPLGFTAYQGHNRIYEGEFKVSKGMSCFQAAENFAAGAYGTFPKVSRDRVIFEDEESAPIVFTDDPFEKGEFYCSMEYAVRRYAPISHVWVKTDTSGGYDTLISDKETRERGILRQRYLNASRPSQASISKADRILLSAKQSLYAIALRCPAAVTDVLGKKAVIYSEKEGLFTGYIVSSLRYTYKNGNEETKLTLRRES